MAADTSALPHDGLKFWQFMIAGSVAGMAEHMAMFPVDTIKTQMQALSSCPLNSATVNQAIRSILKSDGATGFYRGIAAMGIGAGPATPPTSPSTSCAIGASPAGTLAAARPRTPRREPGGGSVMIRPGDM
ncbi:hypothetical protein SASPL_135794 [Salvia splendens]|uniref:Uncharacterized protein n=1 Tax=Salvia splendens TaxID=180675 RepID=A0A8X8X080_SALSN|nr:hypothetical protein SASPL_135794 [Salvia splendens]